MGPNERVLWCAQPDPRRFAMRVAPFAAMSALMILMMLVMPSAMFWWAYSDLKEMGAPLNPMFRSARLGFFVLLALVLLVSGWCVSFPFGEYRRARMIVYAVTNQRVIGMCPRASAPWRKVRHRAVTSINPWHPMHLKRIDRRDGSGDVLLYPGSSNISGRMMLLDIPQARTAERLIRQTFNPN